MPTPMLWKSLSVKLVGIGHPVAQSVALVAASAPVEQLPATLGVVAHGVRVTGDEVIERCTVLGLRPLVGCDGSHEIVRVGLAVEDGLECVPVGSVAGDGGHRGVHRGLPHLEGIRDRKRGLLLERRCAAVPELAPIVKRVQDGRRVALSHSPADADRRRLPVGERALRVVTRGAGDRTVGREPALEEEPLAERDLLGRLGIVGRRDAPGELDG